MTHVSRLSSWHQVSASLSKLFQLYSCATKQSEMKYTPNFVTRCLLDLACERKEKHIVFTESLWEVQSRDFDSQENLKILDVQVMHLLGC